MKRNQRLLDAHGSTLAWASAWLLAWHSPANHFLRVFSGGQNQRPDLMRKLFDEYQKANPGVKIDIETGGATSELQRQYLQHGAQCQGLGHRHLPDRHRQPQRSTPTPAGSSRWTAMWVVPPR